MSLSQSMPRDLSRRSVLGGGLAASAALLAACSGGSSTSAAPASSFANDADRWMQAKGTKLTFITENTPPSTGIKKIVERGDFKKLTGIDVEVLQFDLPVMLQKAELDLQGKRQVVKPENAAQSKRLTIMGDKDIPYRLLKKVMVTGARADYSDVSFAVRQRADL